MPAYNSFHDDKDRTASSGSAISVSPNDSVDLDSPARGLYIGVTGNVRVLLVRDTSTVDFIGVQAGTVLPIRVKRVYSSGTTATNLVALL